MFGMSGPVSFQEAIGSFVSKFRHTHGLTLDAIAREGRRYGATWGANSIRNIENGNAAATLQTLLILAASLGRASGEPVTLDDLLGDAEQFSSIRAAIFDDAPIRREWLARVLKGEPATLFPSDFADAGEHTRRIIDGLKPSLENMNLPPDYEQIEEYATQGHEPTLAERRAAAKLSITPENFALWAWYLWGSSLDDEAARQAGNDSTPQARGKISRKLAAELAERAGATRG